jgi:hypothetical protein
MSRCDIPKQHGATQDVRFRPVAILICPPGQVYVEMGQLDDEDRPFVLARLGAPARFS